MRSTEGVLISTYECGVVMCLVAFVCVCHVSSLTLESFDNYIFGLVVHVHNI